MIQEISSGKRILIPINFSKASLNLFDYGLELCHALNKSMMLLYVTDISGFNDIQKFYEYDDLIKEEVKEKIKNKYLNRAQKKYPNVPIYVAIKGGDILDKVLTATKLKKIDQVLISTGVNSILSENVAEVIEKAACSILLIPDDIPFHPLRHFLYVTDYKKADFLKLKRVIKLAKYYDSEITMLHIYREIEIKDIAYESQFEKLINKKFHYKKMDFAILSGEDIVSKICNYSLKVKADKIVILKKDKTFIQNLFQPSITKELVSRIKVPIVIFHESIKF
jgi:nucleotide-binding universal stress UspA family protein